MELLFLAAGGLEAALVGTLPLEADALFEVFVEGCLGHLLGALDVRAEHGFVLALALVGFDVLVGDGDAAAELEVFALEFCLAQNVAHEDVGVLVDGGGAAHRTGVGFFLPLVDALATVVVLALSALHRVFHDFETNLTEEEAAGVFLALRQALSRPTHAAKERVSPARSAAYLFGRCFIFYL